MEALWIAVGGAITALGAVLVSLLREKHGQKREERQDTWTETLALIAEMKRSREENETKMRETEDRLVRRLEEKDAAHLKCETEKARLTERLARYERPEGGAARE